MGHRCCSKQKVKRGLWSPEEDEKLITHVTTYGHGSWSSVPKLAGLQRCGKSCRLRWINYLRPDLKKGSFTQEEEQIIIDVHRILGNRWAQIAKHLPGRTDNEVKNFWNSCIKKKLISQGLDPQTHNLFSSSSHQRQLSNKKARTTFVLSHENQKQPISAFSMNSMVHEKTNYIPPSLISPPNNILQPTEISTVDQHKDPILGIANSRNSATWTVRDQINYSSQDMQYYYGSSSMENSTPNVSSSSSSSMDIHQQYQTKSGNLLDELCIWDSSFHPFEALKTISEAEYHKSPQGLVNNDHQQQQQQQQLRLQENDEKIWENQNDQTFENYSFDYAFMESALTSEALMCNDLSSGQYDRAWNYYQA